jgi:hypothetical protein
METKGSSAGLKNNKSFDAQYNSYLSEVEGVFPEYTREIQQAREISRDDQLNFFGSWFYGQSGGGGGGSGGATSSAGSTDINKSPIHILPGVQISQELWQTLSENTRHAILEYMRVLGICAFFEKGLSSTTDSGHRPDWAEQASNDWQKYMTEGLENLDLGRFTDFFKSFFENLRDGEGEGEDAGNNGTSEETANNFFKKFPKIPERFLKGHMAKFAEELVRDINPEELGFTPELIAEIESSPSRAFDILISMLTKNPQFLQGTIQKIGKKLQAKIQSGAINPAEIAREAEEMIKDFADNPEMIELMENMKSIFGMSDLGLARKAGKEGSARLAAVRVRLQKKMESKNAKTTSTTAAAGGAAALAPISAQNTSINPGGNSNIVESMTLDDIVKSIENSAVTGKSKNIGKNSNKVSKKK